MRQALASALVIASVGGAALAQDLNICVEGAYPPFSFTNADGTVDGFDVDIANALCAEMDVTCEMVQTEWVGIIPALLERKCDAIVASMSITEERRKLIDFSNKYYNTPARFVGPEGAELDDLRSMVVGVQRNTLHQDFMIGAFPEVTIDLYNTVDGLFDALVAGEIDAVMSDSIAIYDAFLNTPAGEGYAYFGPPYAEPEYHGIGAAVGVRQGETELRNAFSHAIGVIRGNGEYRRINEKYFSFDIYGG
ncbi:MAG: transporter substrate-binding domain-containing protein [Pseudomonadota bacterium]